MAITGAWKARQSVQSGALKWGTGYNPVHNIHGGTGRNIAPHGTENEIDHALVEQGDPSITYTDEDMSSVLFGYGVDTGTADRPGWDRDVNRADVPNGWPSPGVHSAGRPGGLYIRSLDHGAERTNFAITDAAKTESVSEGWRNKVHDPSPLIPNTSDPSQYEMQTSMTQLHKVRAGSQASGRASEHIQPIASRAPGPRIKVWSDSFARRWDMTPREQGSTIRPFWNRRAGTGYAEWMAPNEMYVSEPLQRTPPNDPFAGQTIPSADSFGYVSEDVVW